jgi:hypothetical protein
MAAKKKSQTKTEPLNLQTMLTRISVLWRLSNVVWEHSGEPNANKNIGPENSTLAAEHK